MKSLAALAVVLPSLWGCASQVAYVSPQDTETAEVTLLLEAGSSRRPQQPFIFAEGKQCVGMRWIGAGEAQPVRSAYTIRVKPQTATLWMQSARVALAGANEIMGEGCGGVVSFEPKIGSRYVLAFKDAPAQCVITLTEVTAAGSVNLSNQLVKRTMPMNTAPGNPETRRMCADPYVPVAG